ncbi:hypothetical protein CANARDRAFT_6420 [[Candida] arabinofermentans NRRL YB-2248]|uniref:NADPH--hemoprotein reductase n=1 Tax=[Candida] arabinofermentans NRRL YB-2248 TaxID=983967 RepID=A0A1E4T551_9ASCO|nr:hypothetical protein CANARDRAFT_6420 [[Candida] arabinofermentans NRRL YB-2248]
MVEDSTIPLLVRVYYGSQTGTASSHAFNFAKELSSRFGLGVQVQVSSLSDTSPTRWNEPSQSRTFNVFFVSSYGDGEQCDDAKFAYDSIIESDFRFENGDTSFGDFKFAMFGFGSSAFDLYQGAARDFQSALISLGAEIVLPYGEGDDVNDRLEDDYFNWKLEMMDSMAKLFKLKEVDTDAVYVPSYKVVELSGEGMKGPSKVAMGEIAASFRDLQFKDKPPFHCNKPYVAEFMNMKVMGANCLHAEIDIRNSKMKYQTGDHVGIYPSNPIHHVERFLQAFGLNSKLETVIGISMASRSSANTATPLWFPSPTTYKAVAQYYLNINKQLSKEMVKGLIQFIQSPDVRDNLRKLVEEPHLLSTIGSYNIAELLLDYQNPVSLDDVPFSWLLETLGALKPRYYSISSSSMLSPTKLDITLRVEAKPFGICGNNIYSILKQKDPSYECTMNYSTTTKLPVFIRRSKFKLPYDSKRPIILIGTGTGIAPFRAFIQERLKANDNRKTGKMLLLYGVRNKSEFWYESEWSSLQGKYEEVFEMRVCFSQDLSASTNRGTRYVHGLMNESADIIFKLIMEDDAYVYVCGRASTGMAKDVKRKLATILGSDETVKKMRITGRYQEDVW